MGTVTFDYDITALGTQYDYTSTDTATVTVTVCDICLADAVDDEVETLVDQPVTIDVLMNDLPDADLIDEFEIGALDDMDELQLDSVSLLETAKNATS